MNSIHFSNHYLKYLNITAILLFVSVAKINEAATNSLTLKINYSHPVPVNLKKYGTNGALLASKIGYGDNRLVDIYKQTEISFTRFPGGSIGNYYNWQNGNFSCYLKPDKRSQKRIDRMNRALITKKARYQTNDFFDFIKNIDGDFSYMLNTMCDTPASNARLLKHMKKNNIDLKYIEMANEIFSPAYTWAYKDATSYISSAKENYAAIKQEYPHAKVGLVVSPLSFSSKHRPEKPGIPNPSWPQRMRQFDILSANSNMADALIIHLYAHPYLKKRFSFSSIKTYQDHYLNSIEQFNYKFKSSIKYLKALGKNKPIWITEWGVTAPINKRKGTFRKYKKSAYQALYVASVLTSITAEKGIELANYHNASDLWLLSKNIPTISPIGKILALFSQSAQDTDTIYNVKLSTGVNNKPVSGIKSVFFASDNKNYLFIINEQNKHYTVNKLNMGHEKYNSYTVDTMYIEHNKFKITKIKSTGQLKTNNKTVEIMPFSVTKITIQ